ncbi:transglutaminase-like domain-containing protein [Leucobacter soli]
MSAAPDPDSLGAPLAEPGVGDADLDAGFDGGFDTEAMPELSAWVAAQQQPATGEGFAELVRRLRERGYLSHALSDGEGERLWIERLSAAYGTRFEQSAGGHSAARLEQLFAQLNSQERQVGEEAPVEQLVAGVGDDEQFAAAAALVARSLGFESRVVLGVRLGGEGAGVPGVPACSDVCTGEHLAAWIEVRDASGWVPFDVSPQVEQPPQAIEKGEQLPEFPTTPEERDANEVDPPLGTGEQSDDADPAEEPPAASWIWPVLRIAGLSVAALALLALPLLFLPFAKRWRRHRRRAEADPELRALGAWQEMLDRAADAGVRVPRAAGRPEVAAVLGTAPARWAAERADRAVFSPSGIGDEEADWMWAAADADRAEREAGFGRMRRIRAAYALSSYGVMFAARRRSTEESAAELPDRTEER